MSSSALSHRGHPEAARLGARPRARAPKASSATLGTPGLAAWLIAAVALPSLPLYLLGASSMATGVLLTCVMALGTAAILHAARRLRFGRRGRWILGIWLLVPLHFAGAMLLVPVDTGRFLASWVLLLAFLAGARALSGLIFEARPEALHKALGWVVAFLLLSAAGGLLGVAPPAALPYEKPVFPFTEPSHFALSFIPFLLYVAVSARGMRQFGWIAVGALLALTLQNMTLLAGTVLVTVVCRFRSSLALVPIAVLLAASFIDIEYYVARLDFSTESNNLSSLVFVQGWQLIEEALRNSAFWGIGFQQLGLRGTEVPVADLIYALMKTDVNLSDGGFTLSKLVSEFGLLGIGAAAAHAVLAWRCSRRLYLHASGKRAMPAADRLAGAIVVAFTLELVVRGAGYFTASSLLYAAALLFVLSRGRRATGHR